MFRPVINLGTNSLASFNINSNSNNQLILSEISLIQTPRVFSLNLRHESPREFLSRQITCSDIRVLVNGQSNNLIDVDTNTNLNSIINRIQSHGERSYLDGFLISNSINRLRNNQNLLDSVQSNSFNLNNSESINSLAGASEISEILPDSYSLNEFSSLMLNSSSELSYSERLTNFINIVNFGSDWSDFIQIIDSLAFSRFSLNQDQTFILINFLRNFQNDLILNRDMIYSLLGSRELDDIWTLNIDFIDYMNSILITVDINQIVDRNSITFEILEELICGFKKIKNLIDLIKKKLELNQQNLLPFSFNPRLSWLPLSSEDQQEIENDKTRIQDHHDQAISNSQRSIFSFLLHAFGLKGLNSFLLYLGFGASASLIVYLIAKYVKVAIPYLLPNLNSSNNQNDLRSIFSSNTQNSSNSSTNPLERNNRTTVIINNNNTDGLSDLTFKLGTKMYKWLLKKIFDKS